MMKISRRELLGAIPVIAVGGTAMAADDPEKHTSGIQAVDDGAREAIEFLSGVFRLDGDWTPDFSFYDDGKEPNSRADQPIAGVRRPHVKIGRTLVAEFVKLSHGNYGAALTGVFGHEFAHVYQMKTEVIGGLLAKDSLGTVRLVEIHADFLAGWAFPQAWWVKGNVENLRVAAEYFHSMGDLQTHVREHHGTHLQRQTIMAAGYTWGLSSPGDPDGASARGLAVMTDLFPQWFRS